MPNKVVATNTAIMLNTEIFLMKFLWSFDSRLSQESQTMWRQSPTGQNTF